VGKTALINRWLDRRRAQGWGRARRVYGWSFYSQGSGDDRQASEDHFLAAALEAYGVEIDPALAPDDKGRHLAQALTAAPGLLVLDGVEPLQYPPGPLAGGLRAPGIKTLLHHLARAGWAGLCLISSRERLTDLAEYARDDHRPDGAVRTLDLNRLAEADGARLLYELGVRRAGAAAIGPADPELLQASEELQGHALTLSLLGRYLALAYSGDVRCRDTIDLAEADRETLGGHAFKVMAAYETWLAREGEQGARALAALRLLGLFDRPAAPASLAALRAAPAIPGLTEALFERPRGWRAWF
jgi:hypothetical protein